MNNCAELFHKLGHDCHIIDQDRAAISTPFNLPDGSPVYAYIRSNQNGAYISDDGDTFMSAMALGLDMIPKFNNSFERVVTKAGASFEEGAIAFSGSSPEMLGVIYPKFLAAVREVSEYMQDRMLLKASDDKFIEDIVAQINRRNPESTIDRHVKMSGASGRNYSFDLVVDGIVVLPLKPKARSTGSALRQIIDIEKSGRPAPLVILDDSLHPRDAEQESTIISAVARVLLMSSLSKGSHPIDFKDAA